MNQVNMRKIKYLVLNKSDQKVRINPVRNGKLKYLVVSKSKQITIRRITTPMSIIWKEETRH